MIISNEMSKKAFVMQKKSFLRNRVKVAQLN